MKRQKTESEIIQCKSNDYTYDDDNNIMPLQNKIYF